MDGQQIYDNFAQGRGTRSIEQIAAELHKLTKTYGTRAQSISDLNTQMESAWTGEASAAAHSGAAALMPALEDSAKKMDRTTESTQNQSTAWTKASHAVEPVPPMPEKPNPWTTGLKAAIPVAGPFMAADDINTYQDGAQAHQRAAQHNVDVMNSYSGQTGGNSAFPRTYATLQPSGGSISLSDVSGPGGISGGQSVAPDTTRASSTFTPSVASVASGGPVSGAPQVNAPLSSGSVPPSITGGSSGSVAPPPPVGGGSGTVGGAGTGTSGTSGGGLIGGPGARDSNRGGTGRAGSNTSRTAGFTRSTNGPGRGLAGDRLRGVPDPKATTGRGGTIGRGGIGEGGAARGGVGDAAGRGAAGESARGLAAGKGTGTGIPGAAAAAESAAGRGATPIGAAGAGRGKGGEDDEHQRPSYLQENDPDEVFIGDLGKTAPPVIGE
jgi:hypothetical protein